MKKSDRIQAGKGTLGNGIIKFIRDKNSANLAELINFAGGNFRRNAVIYNIKQLYEKKEIQSFLKGPGLKDEEIYYSIAPGDYPQDIHNLKKIIVGMCGKEELTSAKENYKKFVNLCIMQGVQRDDAIKLAYDLISKYHSGLENLLAFELFYYYDQIQFTQSDNELTISGPYWNVPSRKYEYFIKLLKE